MNKTRKRLRFEARLRDLAAAGSPVDCSVATISGEATDVEICQCGGVYESMVFELPDGRAGYIFDLAITNQTAKTIYCSETELRTPWEDDVFDWLPDPKEIRRTVTYLVKKNGRRKYVESTSDSYRFSGGAQLEYPRDLVLNHILVKGCALQPRRPLKGLLLAIGGPMPHDVRHGQWLKPTLALITSDHREYTAELQLWADRLEVDKKKATKTLNLHRDPLGFEVSSPVVVGNEHGPAHGEASRVADTR
jgi:hypothetical protein